MKKRKRALILLIVFLLIFTVSVSAVNAAEVTTVPTGYVYIDDFSISLKKEGTAHIHSYHGNSAEVVIPYDVYYEYIVTEIEEYAFADNTTLEDLWLLDAEDLRVIGKGAFSNCSSLKEVVLPDYVEQLGSYAFYGCTSLYRADLYANISVIPESCFQSCESLVTFDVPSTVSVIGDLSFADCTSLKYVNIPDNVTDISDTAFDGCDDLHILCTTGSYAQSYAQQNGITCLLTDITLLLGDTNADGDISVMDITLLQRHVAGYTVSDPNCVEFCGDIDGGGTSVQDVTYLQRYMAKYYVLYDIGSEISYLDLI